jgi:hypothetical protein
MPRLVLTAPMAKVAAPELVQRLERALRLFPELGDDPVTVGVTFAIGAVRTSRGISVLQP